MTFTEEQIRSRVVKFKELDLLVWNTFLKVRNIKRLTSIQDIRHIDFFTPDKVTVHCKDLNNKIKRVTFPLRYLWETGWETRLNKFLEEKRSEDKIKKEAEDREERRKLYLELRKEFDGVTAVPGGITLECYYCAKKFISNELEDEDDECCMCEDCFMKFELEDEEAVSFCTGE